MDQEEATVSMKKFFIIMAGRTNGAHQAIVEKLESIGHTEVFSAGESDYLLVFCPVESRTGTDIREALLKIPGGKPIILVVMHHTFNPQHVVADSRQQVNNPNVYLTVDCLFYRNELLTCNHNDIAWNEVQRSFGVYTSQVSTLQAFKNHTGNCLRSHPRLVMFVVFCVVVKLMIILIEAISTGS